jgi:hypothetical protein
MALEGIHMDTSKVTEHFEHDTCPGCGKPSIPLEGVPDQSGRGCGQCGREWVEDLSRPARTGSTVTAIDDFTKAYIEAALWSSTDDAGNPLDNGKHELAEETRAKMAADCAQFQTEQAEWLAEDYRTAARASHGCTVEESAGHDFWLTRCGHGAGFWDGDWEEPAATKLTEASKEFGNVDLYIGDDGLIYGD